MNTRSKDAGVVFSFSGAYVSWVHTIVAFAAFIGALVVGVALHYKKLVQNEHYGYPQEWFPSVSATIGDRYPERAVFQVFIAITSGPRFALVALWYLLTARPNSNLPKIIAGIGLFRTLTCGGWTYVTSTDDHNWHDIFMVSYLLATVPWTIGCLMLSPPNPKAVKYRKIFGGGFFVILIPLTYFFLQHKIHKVAGAYTIYAFFEWATVLLDVGFDAVTALDFEGYELIVRDVKGSSRGLNKRLVDSTLDEHKGKEAAQVFGGGFSWNEVLDASADVYNGFAFWSILTSLGVLVWYFPLWHMGLSGYEAIIITTMSPVLLGIGPLRRLVLRNIRYMHLSSMVGLAAWLVKPPDLRLFTVGFAVAMGSLSWSATFYMERVQPARLEKRICAFAIGLMASNVAKYAFKTNNPIWPIMHAENGGWNKLGLVLAILAVLRSTRDSTNATGYLPTPTGKKGSSTLAALGLGSLIFAMHWLLTDSSTMILWVWSGFPVRGPLAVPHGSYTITCMGIGLLFGLFYPGLARSWTAFGIASVGAAILTISSNWFGFYGGLALAFYVMAVAPVLISSAVQHGPAFTFGLAFFVYNFMLLFSIWVIAYAFVPGGPLVREHTDWVVITMMVLFAAGIFSATATSSQQSTPRRTKPVNPAARRQRSYYTYIIICLQLLSFAISYLRFPSYDYTPYHPDSNVITAGIWTTHFSLDNPMWDSTRRVATLIKEMELDVVGLLESDLQRIIMGNRDSMQVISEEYGYYTDQGPGPDKHTWGCALLSKFPIVNSTHHLLPSPVGELAPAIAATIEAYGTLVDVFVFHSGQEEDPEDRRLQSEYMSRLMGQSTNPSILLSYLVTKPLEGNYNNYVSAESGMHDIDPTDWDRWCEYILYKGMRRTGYARVSRSTITDTELQVGKFVVGLPENTSNELLDEAAVPEDLRFPAEYLAPGLRGHEYHVFDRPRYYA